MKFEVRKFLSTQSTIFLVFIFILVFSSTQAFAKAPMNVWATYTDSPAGIGFGINSTMSCDFDGDHIKDMAVSSYYYSSQTGKVMIYFGGTALSATPDATITGEATNNRFGDGMGCGDFNGDGVDDLSVGAVRYSSYSGRNYIFYGRFRSDWTLLTNASQANVKVTGEGANNNLGNKSAIGDINEDGKGDLLVGAEFALSNRGRAYIIFGSTNTAIDINASAADIIVNNDFSADVGALGDDVSIGDVSGDSIPDILMSVGDWLDSDGGQSRAIIINGSSTITTGTYNASSANTILLANSDPNINGFGYAIRSGDVNGDGKGDLIVGADHMGIGTGIARASIFYGGLPTGTHNVADVVNQTITGEQDNDMFSMTMATGDINHDGIADIIATAYYYPYNTSPTGPGRMYVFLGGNGLAGKTNASQADYIIDPPVARGVARYGWWNAVGDINGDGWDEFTWVASANATGYIYSISHIAPAVTLDSLASSFDYGTTVRITGSASDTDSGNISKVEYSLDNESWQNATTTDGAFDSSTENFYFDLSSLSSGSHSVRVRSTDSENAATAEADYRAVNFAVNQPVATATPTATTSPALSILPKTGQETTNNLAIFWNYLKTFCGSIIKSF